MKKISRNKKRKAATEQGLPPFKPKASKTRAIRFDANFIIAEKRGYVKCLM